MNPKKIKTKYGDGVRGTLDDGNSIVARQGSSEGRVTLELRRVSNGRKTEFRYGESSK